MHSCGCVQKTLAELGQAAERTGPVPQLRIARLEAVELVQPLCR